MPSTDLHGVYPSPSRTLKPLLPASRYSGPHPCVYSDDWKALYGAAEEWLMQKEVECTEAEMVELVRNTWDAAFESDDDPELDLVVDMHQGSNMTVFSDDDDHDHEPPQLIATQPQPHQPGSKKEKRRKKRKRSKKAKQATAAAATRESSKKGAHDFQGSEAVKPGGHTFFGDEE